ncbi:MAG: DHH family phosphoesterase [Candidatus Saccharimonadales bacterium]
MFEEARKLIDLAKKIIVIQAENPDGDSLGSSLALEEILSDMGKQVILYCPIEIPKYMRYIVGWDRVVGDFDTSADLAIIVDTTAEILITKVLEVPGVRHYLETHSVLAIDHHVSESNLSFNHTLLAQESVATGEIIYNLAVDSGWTINKQAAENMLVAIMSDSLGLTVQNVTAGTYFTAGKLAELGANNSEIEKRRREHMKKSAEILKYKGVLLERIEYFLDDKLAIIRIPWEEIKEYSDQYNPSVLVLDEMRYVENVEVAIAIKTYPDGKLTGKIRSNLPVSQVVAGFFGGGGHEYAAGFRVYESIDTIIPELLNATDKAIKEYGHDTKVS